MTGANGRFSHLQGTAISDIGRKRKNNEDSFGAFPEHGVWCVADGMGGGDDGEVASAAVVKSVDAYLSNLPDVSTGAYAGSMIAKGMIATVEGASDWIFRRTKKNNLKGCGSTFVGIVFDATVPGTAIALNVGDSRLYRLRGRELKQMTKDHSVAEMMGAKDESQLNPMFRGMILRAVGIERSVEVDQTPISVNAGDVILICSDGLTRMLADKRICEIIREGKDDIEAAARELISEANKAGGIDNVTVELIKVGPLPKPLPAVAAVHGEDSLSSSSSTVKTLEREYGGIGRWLSRRVLVPVAIFGVVLVVGALAVLLFKKGERRVPAAPVVEVMPQIKPVRKRMPAPDVVRTPDVAQKNEIEAEPRVGIAATNLAAAASSRVEAPNLAAVSNQVAASNEEKERIAVENELRVERERRKREEAAAVKLEQERRTVARKLAGTYDFSFVDFACFVNDEFGKGTSDRAYSLCRKLHSRSKDHDASVCATDLAAEIGNLAKRIVAKYGRGDAMRDATNAAMVARCQAVVDKDPASPEIQQHCIELFNFMAERRKQDYVRHRQ